MIEVKKLSKDFKTPSGTVHALSNINFKLKAGQFASIVGKSGSGKTTLLGLLGGLDKASSGQIIVDDQDLSAMTPHQLISYRCLRIGYVFQGYNLIPNLNALQNVMLPMEFAKAQLSASKARAKELLKEVGLNESEMERKPSLLSGGQQQRVAIARALANKPKLILADEPTGNLDSLNGKKIFDLLHNLAKTNDTTIIVVTHDLEIAGKTDIKFKIEDGKLKQ
jgi:putative ABC transport system ATP-binding protein